MSFQTPTHGGGDEISFSPDLTWVAMKPDEFANHTDIRRVSDNKVAVSLYLFADEAELVGQELPPSAARFWLALTPGGFYDGSPNIERWLRWRQGNTLLPLGALKNERRRPDAVRAALLAG